MPRLVGGTRGARRAPLLLFAVVVVACSQAAHVVDTTRPPTSSASGAPDTSSPMPTGVVGVSASHPSADAAAAMEACQVGQLIPLTQVVGMARLASARDVPRYVPLTGREPEIQTDAPAWVIQVSGDVSAVRNGEVWKDPTCVVIDDQSGFYATGRVTNVASGKVSAPGPPAIPPDSKLPPLLP